VRLAALGVFGTAVLGPVGAVAAPDPADEQAKLATAVSFRCTSDGQVLDVANYYAALHWDSVEPQAAGADAQRDGVSAGGEALRAKVVVFVAVPKGPFHPLTYLPAVAGSPAVYEVDCDKSALIGVNAEDFPSLEISSPNAGGLAAFFQNKAADAKQKQDASLLAFHSAGSKPGALFAAQRTGGVTLGSLLKAYVKANADPGLLQGLAGDVRIKSLETPTDGEALAVDIKRIGRRPRATSEAAAAAPEAEAARPAAPAAKSAGGPADIGPPPGRELQNVQIKLASKALADLDLAREGMLDTAGYCQGVRAAGQGVFELEDCSVDAAGRVPVTIRGLEPIVIEPGKKEPEKKGAAPIVIDNLLKHRAYSAVYPADWRMPAASRVEVPAGELLKTLEQPVAIAQWGLSGCSGAATIRVDDVLDQTVTLPEKPCFAFDVSLPTALYGEVSPAAISGCRPGLSIPVAAVDGKLRCAATASESKAGKKIVRMLWSGGFEEIDLQLPINREQAVELDLTADNLRSSLRPTSLLAAAPRPGEPKYAVRSVTYRTGKQACGPAVAQGEDGRLPTIGEAGCKQLPTAVEFAMELDDGPGGGGVPSDAFEASVVHTVALGGTSAPAPFDASRARRKLPISFSPEKQKLYSQQYSEATDLLVKGAKIYSDAYCSQPAGQQAVELFAKPSGKADYQWPVWARVLDNEGQPLTNCAQAVVEKRDASPYLTFEFVGTRAVGPRRVILLARSQDFMNKKGMPKALDTALTRFLEAAIQAHKQGAPLSPIDVLIVSEDGTMRRIFTGEQMVLEPQTVQTSLADLDRTGPKVPDLSLLRLQPETKDAGRILLVMDGSLATARNASELRLLGSDLSSRPGGDLQFYLSSESCELWAPHSQQLKCVDIGALPQAKREQALISAFTSFLNAGPAPAKTEKKDE
jgi:hypothetical protein